MSLDAELELHIERRTNRARNEAIGVLGFLAIVIGIVTSVGVWSTITSTIETEIREGAGKVAFEELNKNNKIAEQIIGELTKKNQIIHNYAKGTEFYLYDHKWTGWYSKAHRPSDSQIPEGCVITNISFTHPLDHNLTYQESFRLEYAKVGLRVIE